MCFPLVTQFEIPLKVQDSTGARPFRLWSKPFHLSGLVLSPDESLQRRADRSYIASLIDRRSTIFEDDNLAGFPGCLCSLSLETPEVSRSHLKRRLSSGKRWKIICERYHSYYASMEERQIRHVPWKACLFKCLHILNMSCNIVKLRGRIFTSRVRVVPYTSFCVQCFIFTKTWPNFLSFWWFQNLAIHTNSYMLDNQPFLVDFTPFLSQCNRMTRTQLHL